MSDRRRSDHFQAYLAMSLHSVSNEVIKNSYQEKLRSSRGSNNERSGSLGALSDSNAIYNSNNNGESGGDYGNKVLEHHGTPANQHHFLTEEKQASRGNSRLSRHQQHVPYSNPGSAIESESYQLKKGAPVGIFEQKPKQPQQFRRSPQLVNVKKDSSKHHNSSKSPGATMDQREYRHEDPSLVAATSAMLTASVKNFCEVPVTSEVRNVQDSAYQASLQRLQKIAKIN